MSLKREIIFYDVSHHSTKHLLAHPTSSAQISKEHYLAQLLVESELIKLFVGVSQTHIRIQIISL